MSKLALGIGATGLTLGAGAGVTTYLLRDTSLSTRLISEGFDVNVTDWQTIFSTYNSEQTHIFNLNNGEQKSKEILERKCKEALSQRNATDTTYKLAKRWCVKEEKVSDILSRLKLKVLKTSTNEDDNTHWKDKVSKVKNITDVATKLGVVSSANDDTNVTKIKEKCTEIIAIKTTSAEFDEKFKLAKDWCSA